MKLIKGCNKIYNKTIYFIVIWFIVFKIPYFFLSLKVVIPKPIVREPLGVCSICGGGIGNIADFLKRFENQKQ